MSGARESLFDGRCLACEEGVPLVNTTADRPDLPDLWAHQYGGKPGTIATCTTKGRITMNDYSRAINSVRIALGFSRSELRSSERHTTEAEEILNAGEDALDLLSNWPAQSSSPCEIQELNNDGVPTGVVWCSTHNLEAASTYEVIHGWLDKNNPAALELCPYKVSGKIETLPPSDGWEKGYYEARLVSTFETLAKIDNAEVSEIVGAFIAGYFADRIDRAPAS
jgi:hypothetical protein